MAKTLFDIWERPRPHSQDCKGAGGAEGKGGRRMRKKSGPFGLKTSLLRHNHPIFRLPLISAPEAPSTTGSTFLKGKEGSLTISD